MKDELAFKVVADMNLNLEQIYRIFKRRGERVVLILPNGEPVVMLPLADYENLSGSGLGHQRPKSDENNLELIDPMQGGVEGDDQYFPEPLD